MPLLAMKEYARQVAANASPTVQAQTIWTGGLQTFRQVPVLDKLGSTLAVVVAWIPDAKGRRLSTPRGGGSKVLSQAQLLLVHAVDTGDEQVAADNFDLALGILFMAYQQANTGIPIKNPLTGISFALREIGEQVDIREEEPSKHGASGLVHYFAEMEVSVTVDLSNL